MGYPTWHKRVTRGWLDGESGSSPAHCSATEMPFAPLIGDHTHGKQVHLSVLHRKVVALHAGVAHLRGESSGKTLLDLGGPLLVRFAFAEALGLVTELAAGGLIPCRRLAAKRPASAGCTARTSKLPC